MADRVGGDARGRFVAPPRPELGHGYRFGPEPPPKSKKKISTLRKIPRELRRLGRQSKAARIAGTDAALSMVWRHVGRWTTRVTGGGLGASARMAVFVIFPRGGVPESTFRTLELLRREGWTPLVVSNQSLSPCDRHRLAGLAWEVQERVNIGYDFGGYRDGVLRLLGRRDLPEELLLLNDSFWLPADPDEGLLARLEAAEGDYVAFSDGYYYGRRSFVRPDRRGDYHFTSFLSLIRGGLVSHPEFRRFWRRYPVSSIKERVIEEGEIGLAHMLFAIADAPRVLYSKAELLDAFRAMSPQRLIEVFLDVSLYNLVWKEDCEAMRVGVLRGSGDIDRIRAFMMESLLFIPSVDGLALEGLASLQFGLLKKLQLRDPDNRRRFLDAADRRGVALDPLVRQEILAAPPTRLS